MYQKLQEVIKVSSEEFQFSVDGNLVFGIKRDGSFIDGDTTGLSQKAKLFINYVKEHAFDQPRYSDDKRTIERLQKLNDELVKKNHYLNLAVKNQYPLVVPPAPLKASSEWGFVNNTESANDVFEDAVFEDVPIKANM